ncbi:hypothetical protein T4E_7257 [Trichinella pseudospiralis]|uniref:Uncharacterized protein n=1 Tax=Trichinella pseudospiralis TaxID=6337 RepID=A0A0V0YAM2_TRIPS|nr:hypothetical protein T4E_7257 [Trichinella pseudospiralis]
MSREVRLNRSAGLLSYTAVMGCILIRPLLYHILLDALLARATPCVNRANLSKPVDPAVQRR